MRKIEKKLEGADPPFNANISSHDLMNHHMLIIDMLLFLCSFVRAKMTNSFHAPFTYGVSVRGLLKWQFNMSKQSMIKLKMTTSSDETDRYQDHVKDSYASTIAS